MSWKKNIMSFVAGAVFYQVAVFVLAPTKPIECGNTVSIPLDGDHLPIFEFDECAYPNVCVENN